MDVPRKARVLRAELRRWVAGLPDGAQKEHVKQFLSFAPSTFVHKRMMRRRALAMGFDPGPDLPLTRVLIDPIG